MQKNPIIKTPEFEESLNNKGKPKKKQTLCVDKRRNITNCGICGSADLLYMQLVYCIKCGAESYDIGTEKRFGYFIVPSPCSCKGEAKEFKGRVYFRTTKKEITIRACAICKSIESYTCPSCRRSQKNKPYWSWLGCWVSPFGEKYCRACGYRHPGFKKC
jgi:hypothetical protein